VADGFFSPSGEALTPQSTPELGWLGFDGPRITFHDSARLHAWLRRIDRWIAYANSVVEE
jgi:hypothetical protein